MERVRDKNFPTVKDLADDLKLKPLNNADLSSEIKTQSIYRIGYELTGLFIDGEELKTNINVLGRKEIDYLSKLKKEKRILIFEKYLSYSFPALIVNVENEITNEIVEIAKIQ